MPDPYESHAKQVFEAYTPLVDGWELAYDIEQQGGRFILIEESSVGAGYWITRHESLVKAAEYHDGNEVPGDYTIEVCIDLATGQMWEAETKTTLVPSYKVEDKFAFDEEEEESA